MEGQNDRVNKEKTTHSKILSYLARIIGVVLVIGLLRISTVEADPRVQQGTPGPYKTYLPMIGYDLIENGPKVWTTSYYMATVDSSTLFNRGCALGTRDLNRPGTQENMVILDFGGPRRLASGEYGARLFTTGVYVSTNQIAEAVKQFGLGYYNCTGADNKSFLVIGIGTNNWVDPNCADFGECGLYKVTYEHGLAWAQMVNQLNKWFVDNRYSGQVSAVGANDIELSWNHYTPTKAWLDGYDAAHQYEMINFGALPGCPYFNSPGAQCGSYPYLWSKEQVWTVIWGSPSVYPLPEIYANSGVNAQQWYLMSVYAYTTHGLAIEFRGVMTQSLSCQVRWESSCTVLDNTPAEGWGQLSGLVNGDARTAHNIRWATDITW